MTSNSQRFFLDARKLGDGGIGTFIKSLVDGLIESVELESSKFELDLVISESFQKKFGIPANWENRKYLNIYTDQTSKYSLSEYLLFPLRWAKVIKKCELYISPHYTLPFFIPIKKMIVIHDLIQVDYPEKLLHRIFPARLIQSAILRADFITTVSEHSKGRLAKFFNINKNNIRIIPNAVRFSLVNNPRFLNEEIKDLHTVLFIGADRAHKRLKFFLDFIKLANDNSIPIRAIVVSKMSKDNIKLLEDFNIAEFVELYDSVDDIDLLKIYSRSSALICTSIYEGFGLPLLEAMSKNISVFAPDLEYSRNLLKEAGYFYDKDSVSDLLRVWMDSVLNLGDKTDKIEKGLAIAKTYTAMNQFNSLIAIVK